MNPIAILVAGAIVIATILLVKGLLAVRNAPVDPAWAEEPFPAGIPDPLPEQSESSRKGAAERAGASNINHDGRGI
ncbi:hypothetical protein LZK98_11780 [Sphingomonas cannabina]|uniref:hypothetical protein n=1 Tax=Sphingomonas cannabina TaxID=2899123 RepID=UPI001F1FEBD6|nr:hypothetical protein [Sphingomonas cannabina]UIJ43771.1 hypothetical protein LZK98_11780 [Sphingomonas cannabina]